MTKGIDTHAHLNDNAFADDIGEVVARAVSGGVSDIVVVGYDLASSEHALHLAHAYGPLWAAVGIHPHDAPQADKTGLEHISTLTQAPKTVAIGEIGLDYYWNTWPKEQQQHAFRQQIDLAKNMSLPFIVHDRDAHGDVLAILREHGVFPEGFVMHCFSGSPEFARECIRLGGHISLAGPVTFHNAARLVEVAKEVPLERLLVETDCPYLSPHPHRGKRNEPQYVRLVLSTIAQLRGISVEAVAKHTSSNAKILFGLKEKV
ncbi:MAG: TatD DNase family protein [Bacillota bacterium]|nr:MAG: TatD DNase family protein [Bacillota bacterium]